MQSSIQESLPLDSQEHGRPFRRLLAEGKRAWGFSTSKHILVLWAIPVVIFLSAAIAALMGKSAYKWYVGEDRFAENLEIIFFGLSAV